MTIALIEILGWLVLLIGALMLAGELRKGFHDTRDPRQDRITDRKDRT